MTADKRNTAGSGPAILQGVLPIKASQIPAEIIAGVTLAALAIPEVMGYTKISGTPVITGLYTILIPMVLFALFGSSRHLVVGADSATVIDPHHAACFRIALPVDSLFFEQQGLDRCAHLTPSARIDPRNFAAAERISLTSVYSERPSERCPYAGITRAGSVADPGAPRRLWQTPVVMVGVLAGMSAIARWLLPAALRLWWACAQHAFSSTPYVSPLAGLRLHPA